MTLAKESGWIISIDQASNAAGVCAHRDGVFIASTTLNSLKKSDPIGKRLTAQVMQLDKWLEPLMGTEEAKIVIFEGVRARLVLITVGAFCTSKYLQNCRLHPRHTFVEASQWKKWARLKGAVSSEEGEIKGIKALYETGWDGVKFPIGSDDEADSVLIYQTWRDRK